MDIAWWMVGIATGLIIVNVIFGIVLFLKLKKLQGAEDADVKPDEEKPQEKWMSVQVWMRETTHAKFKAYIEYQEAEGNAEKGKKAEHTPDEALVELMTLYVLNRKMFGKASTKAICKAITEALEEAEG
jgi:hypothetical protein